MASLPWVAPLVLASTEGLHYPSWAVPLERVVVVEWSYLCLEEPEVAAFEHQLA